MGKSLGWVSGVVAVALTSVAGAMVTNCGDNLPPMPSTINGTANPATPSPETSDAATSDGATDGGAG
jgi:hypothetical protein